MHENPQNVKFLANLNRISLTGKNRQSELNGNFRMSHEQTKMTAVKSSDANYGRSN